MEYDSLIEPQIHFIDSIQSRLICIQPTCNDFNLQAIGIDCWYFSGFIY